MPKKRKILSDINAPYIQSIIKLIETQSKETLIIWVLDYCNINILPIWDKYYPNDLRVKDALIASNLWLLKDIKLPQAKKAILNCHKAAREVENNPIAQAAARTIGQSASTIHSARHCLGLVAYGALAISYEKMGIDASWNLLEKSVIVECAKMEDALYNISIENEKNPVKINWYYKN